MRILKLILDGFFLPGTLFLKRMGISIEEDGGVMRSFVNMCFWGVIALWIALKFFTD